MRPRGRGNRACGMRRSYAPTHVFTWPGELYRTCASCSFTCFPQPTHSTLRCNSSSTVAARARRDGDCAHHSSTVSTLSIAAAYSCAAWPVVLGGKPVTSTIGAVGSMLGIWSSPTRAPSSSSTASMCSCASPASHESGLDPDTRSSIGSSLCVTAIGSNTLRLCAGESCESRARACVCALGVVWRCVGCFCGRLLGTAPHCPHVPRLPPGKILLKEINLNNTNNSLNQRRKFGVRVVVTAAIAQFHGPFVGLRRFGHAHEHVEALNQSQLAQD